MVMTIDLSFAGSLSKTGCLIILHGLFGSKQNWGSIVKALNSKGIKTVAVDLRNHGNSGWAKDMTLVNMTMDLIRFMDKNEIQKAHILGHSLGGKIAMNTALEFPNRVQSLISVDMSLKPKDNSKEFLFYIYEMKKVVGVQSKSIAAEVLSKTIKNPLILQFLLTNLVKSDSGYRFRINLESLEQSLPLMLKSTSDTRKTFDKNVLFIGGSMADYINPTHHDYIKTVFPRADFEYLETGHWVHYEKPLEFMELVYDFIKNKE